MRQLLVAGEKTFRISVKDDAKITFGPWAPQQKKSGHEAFMENNSRGGTLRIYDGVNIIAVFSGVTSYRDMAIDYSEMVVKEEGATIWKSDHNGYERENKVSSKKEWIEPKLIANGRAKARHGG